VLEKAALDYDRDVGQLTDNARNTIAEQSRAYFDAVRAAAGGG